MHSSAIVDVAIVGAGVGGLAHLHYARRAGLTARVFDRQEGVGGLWRRLPAWQDIQISAADWALGDLPLAGTAQPDVLKNIESWVTHLGLGDGLTLGQSVRATHDGALWNVDTPQGRWQARNLVAATGAHNVPLVPAIRREASAVTEMHSSELHDPGRLAGRNVLVVGGGASAFDLLDLAVAHGVASIHWAWRAVRWFTPTGKPKAIAGSVRPFARMQMSGMTREQQSAAIGGDLRARYEKFGLQEIVPTQPFEVQRHQLIPGRHRMLGAFASLHRHAATVRSIREGTVTLSDGTDLTPDVLLWGTGYGVDLSWIDHPAFTAVRTVEQLTARCGGLVRSLDAPNLYIPGVGLDGIGSAPWSFALLARSIASQIRGAAQLGLTPVTERLNHFDIVTYLAPRDPASFPGDWRARYRSLALDTPDDQPYPLPD